MKTTLKILATVILTVFTVGVVAFNDPITGMVAGFNLGTIISWIWL